MSEQKTAKVRNVSGEDLTVGWLNGRLVLEGQAVEVPLEDVWAYTSQPGTWEPYDAAAKKITKDGAEAEDARVAAQTGTQDEPADAEPDEPSKPESKTGAAGTQED